MVTREDYAPYHTMTEFQQGYDDYMASRAGPADNELSEAGGQAYDRGAEYAMRTARFDYKITWPFGRCRK
jgi:hypothetical protein